ncbi:PEGA domain-containing protein [Sorangium sp. So ce1097]|uniref:PEGA domain-containing protein n=1 Tax=Sorangium sp. So ce1097 TaxID=3133330 RepID=UPI003F63A860
MRSGGHLLSILLALGASTGLASAAEAEGQHSTPAPAADSAEKDLVRRARKARRSGKWNEAYDAYKAAFEAAEAVPSAIGARAELAGELGLCALALRKYREAAEHLTWSLEQGHALTDEVRLRFEAGQAKAAFYLIRVLLSVDPPDAEVFIDGKPIGRTARTYKLFLEPGRHMVRARAPGREDALHVVSADAGSELEMAMQLPRAAMSSAKEAPATPKAVSAPPAARPQPPSPWASWPGTLRIAGITVATAGVSVGAVLIIRAGRLDDDLSARRDRLLSEPSSSSSMCWQAPRNSPCGELARLQDARNLSGRAGLATVIIGGVVGAVTAASFFTDFSFLGSSPARERVHVSPVANGNEIGARIEGLW